MRSQPIQRCSVSLKRRSRCSRMKRGASPAAPRGIARVERARSAAARVAAARVVRRQRAPCRHRPSRSAARTAHGAPGWPGGAAAAGAPARRSMRRRSACAGITTITRCSGGMPCASARRGRCCGRADSLIRRLITATTASEAGNSISSAASSASHAGAPAPPARRRGAAAARPPGRACPAAACPGRPAAPGGAQRRATAARARSCRPSARTSAGRPAPRSQWLATAAALSARLGGVHQVEQRLRHRHVRCGRCAAPAARCRAASGRAWRRARPRTPARSSISCISALVRATMSGQSASPMARSEVTALLTLRLSAAWSALCCACIAARSGSACAASRGSAASGRLAAAVLQALRHLRQEHAADAALVQQRQQLRRARAAV